MFQINSAYLLKGIKITPLEADNDDIVRKNAQQSISDATDASYLGSNNPSIRNADLAVLLQTDDIPVHTDCTIPTVAVESIPPTENVFEWDGNSDRIPLLQTTSQSTQSPDHHSLSAKEAIRYASMEFFAPWFPECDPTHRRAKTFKAWWTRRKTVLVNACIVSALVLLANSLGAGILFQQHADHPIFAGDCVTTSRLNMGAHIVINILSSILLGASNLCMQLLSAPTRAEVDRAHQKRKWLDIGIPNLRNLYHIARQRKIVWIVLASASLPIHVFYNSAVYNMTPQNTYVWAVVTPSFLSRGPFSINDMSSTLENRKELLVWGLDGTENTTQHAVGTSNNPTEYFDDFSQAIARIQHEISSSGSSFERLSKFDCLKRYTTFERDASDVILVSTYDTLNSSADVAEVDNSLLVLGDQINTWLWVDTKAALWECGVSNSFNCFRPEKWLHSPQLVEDWNVRGYKVDYCLAKERYLGNKCELRFELPIMISKSLEQCYKSVKSLTRSSYLHFQLDKMCLYLLYSNPIRVGRS
jgi:hypothetical protein